MPRMSDWNAHVYCTCFQDGMASTPPYPRSNLTVNRFGVVTLVGSNDHAEDPDDLWCWRVGMTEDGGSTPSPCTHNDMKIVDTIFYWPGSRSYVLHCPVFEDSLNDVDFPVLTELVYRPQADDYPSGGIWATASEAVAALAELRALTETLPTSMTADDAHFVRELTELFTAAIATGNPIILHYDGIVDGAW